MKSLKALLGLAVLMAVVQAEAGAVRKETKYNETFAASTQEEYDLLIANQTSELWSYGDMAAGALIGMYAPLAQRVRSYDCFSEFFVWTSEFVMWHVTFYGWWSFEDPMSWVFVVLNFGL